MTSAVHTADQCVAPFRSPSSQNPMPRNCASGAKVSSEVTTADPADPIITPIKSSDTGVSFAPDEPERASTRQDRPRSSKVAPNAPSAAPAATPHSAHHARPLAAPASIIAKAPTDAPLDTPSTYGSANALRISSCSSAPAE